MLPLMSWRRQKFHHFCERKAVIIHMQDLWLALKIYGNNSFVITPLLLASSMICYPHLPTGHLIDL